MRAAIAVVAALMVIDVLIIAGTATGTPYFAQLALHFGLSLGLALVANVFIWAIMRPTVGPALAIGSTRRLRACFWLAASW